MARSRPERVIAALFRSATLTLENPRYLDAVSPLNGELLRSDLEPADLTVEALGLADRPAEVWIVGTEPGIIKRAIDRMLERTSLSHCSAMPRVGILGVGAIGQTIATPLE